jgi:hypothetical protein
MLPSSKPLYGKMFTNVFKLVTVPVMFTGVIWPENKTAPVVKQKVEMLLYCDVTTIRANR